MWNKLSSDCVDGSSVDIFKDIIHKLSCECGLHIEYDNVCGLSIRQWYHCLQPY